MKAIILAAGEGSRLRPLTDSTPKCLVELAGKPLLDWQTHALRQCGIHNIIVVRGYLARKIDRPDLRFYDNRDYATTNMVASLWCAAREFTEDIVVCYADIIFNNDILEPLVKSPSEISVVVDLDWEAYWKERFDDPLADAESLKMDSHGKITSIGQKTQTLAEIEGQYIGLMKFTTAGLEKINASYQQAVATSVQGGQAWGQSRPVAKAYMTDLLQGLILEGALLQAVKVSGGWLEIDSLADYTLAKKYLQNGHIQRR
ncbi:MAG: phosphocholine cytidylyltransferase family protein [Nitrospinota bacterium]|nr:phosphocholine cytidylyltransferase family protein [Nitrospinota bacterium]